MTLLGATAIVAFAPAVEHPGREITLRWLSKNLIPGRVIRGPGGCFPGLEKNVSAFSGTRVRGTQIFTQE